MNNTYTCPMHPEVTSDTKGRCPKCGMDLELHHASGQMAHRSHGDMMATPEAARDFLKRFYIVTGLLVPLAVFSEPVGKFIGIADFPGRNVLEFAVATVIFYFSLIFFEHASHEIRAREYGMMTLVSLGVGSGYLFSVLSTFIPSLHTEFYLEISTLIWILLFGHYLEARSSTAAGDALAEVAKLLPKQAHRKIGRDTKDIDIESLNVSDTVVVRPGEKVPADGKITRGSANFNESHLTGESKPVMREAGSEIPAGAINLDGVVEVRIIRTGASSTVGQIQTLIQNAQKTKPSVQKLADRAARWLTFAALGVSVLSLLYWSVVAGQPIVFAATLAITVLVIACPHALGLAIPTVSTIATRLAVKNGLFIKDLSKIEIIKDATYVVFDKTGTLTKGSFGVTNVTRMHGKEPELLSIAASIEVNSTHVIGIALHAYAKDHNIPIQRTSNVKNHAGKGMEATIAHTRYVVGSQSFMREQGVWTTAPNGDDPVGLGETLVYVANSEEILGRIALSDEVKPEAKEAIDKLHAFGLKVAMLTGDNRQAAARIAQPLSIDTVFADVLPKDKYAYIKKLQEKGEVVVMAGDGVNDAPALTQANAGVAIGTGTDVAVEAGDVILTQSNPLDVVRLILLSRKVYRKMAENLVWAAGYNIVALPAAAGLFIPFGFRLTPAVGALLMSLSSVIVVLNALSLRKTKLD